MRSGLLILLLCLTAAMPLCALEVAEVRWGFEGKVTPARFNLLSLRLVNRDDRLFDGTLTLQLTNAMGGPEGARLIAPCYVAPLGERWVQFYPYVSDSEQTWTVRWREGSRARKAALPKPQVGGLQQVLLVDPSAAFAGRSRLRQFQVSLFPPLSTATDSLHSVALDSAPRWDASRRQAFLDWLRRGGIVHLLRDDAGHFPRFSGALALLNAPLPRTRHGAGLVVRHDATRAVVDRIWLNQAGYALPQLRLEDYNHNPSRLDEPLFARMRRIIQPDHDWDLIFLMGWIYLLLLGPINWLLARKRRIGRTLIFFAICVGGFTWAYRVIGQRGYGEQSSIHAVSVARSLGDGTYDVTQWGNAFVTRGGEYRIAHPGAQHLYSTPEQTRAQASSGKQGALIAQIPQFSSQAYLYRGRIAGPDHGLRLLHWRPGKPMQLEIGVGPAFPRSSQIYLAHGDTLYQMRLDDNRLTPTGEPQKLNALSHDEALSELYSYWIIEELGQTMTLDELRLPLIARQLGLFDRPTPYGQPTPKKAQVWRPKNQLDLFVYSDEKGRFCPAAAVFKKRESRVLYHHILYLREK